MKFSVKHIILNLMELDNITIREPPEHIENEPTPDIHIGGSR